MRTVIALGAFCIALASCQPAAAPAPIESVPLKEVILDNLKSPWSIAFMSNDDALISEKGGDLIRVNLTTKDRHIISGLPLDIVSDRRGNNGIFDVLLDPDFKNNNQIYLAYAAQKGTATTTKVIRAVFKDNALTDINTVLVAEPYTEEERYHYGGGMVFGADGKLYITIGERLFSEEDQPDFPIAQNLQDRRGKIYRLNSDGSIPADNPNFGSEAVKGLYAIGIRAAQGIALNPKTDEIWFSEHGTHQGDEINRLVKGANYGWPVKTTGKYRYNHYDPPKVEDAIYTDPEWYWLQTVAPTGLTFYQGEEFPLWQNDLIVPGLSRGSLWRINFEGSKIISVEELFTGDHVRTRKVSQSPDGKLYMLTDTEFTIIPGVRAINNGAPAGQLIRIKNAARN